MTGMSGKTLIGAAVLAAGILAAAQPVTAHGGKVEILYGQPAGAPVAVAANEGGRRVTVLRGPAVVAAPPKTVTAEPVTYIDGERVHAGSLEPAGSSSSGAWFLDRSGGRTVLVHCYAQDSAIVGGGNRIFCDARRF